MKINVYHYSLIVLYLVLHDNEKETIDTKFFFFTLFKTFSLSSHTYTVCMYCSSLTKSYSYRQVLQQSPIDIDISIIHKFFTFFIANSRNSSRCVHVKVFFVKKSVDFFCHKRLFAKVYSREKHEKWSIAKVYSREKC